jgi:hypothetical protein
MLFFMTATVTTIGSARRLSLPFWKFTWCRTQNWTVIAWMQFHNSHMISEVSEMYTTFRELLLLFSWTVTSLEYVLCTRWFKYDRDYLCVNKSQFVPDIFEPPYILFILSDVTVSGLHCLKC